MIDAIQNFIRGTDSVIARLYLSIFTERNALMPFLFHSLFRDEREIALNHVDPLQRTTVAQFRQFIEYYLEHGYRFISPADLLAGLKPRGKYAMITFDDGYYNNLLAVPILKEFNVPALFFISTNHVRENKSFWWDVLHRERTLRGARRSAIYDEAISLKSLRNDEIEALLVSEYGSRSLRPRGDIDRPLSPDELRAFASNPLVHIGNHTADHAILTNYPPDQARAQIRSAQRDIQEMTGITPIAIAYPNGGNTDRILEICREEGLRVGFTVRPEKRGLPLDADSRDLLRIGRFTPHGDAPIVAQCRTYRSDLLFYGKFRDGYLRLLRGQVAQ